MTMDDDGSDWTLDEHMTAGTSALSKIALANAASGEEPVCHHFSELAPVDPELESVAEKFAPVVRLFAEMGLDFLPDRLEAWEQAIPNRSWLASRIPALYELAASNGLRFQGWTWEPSGKAIIGATDILVINNRTF